MLSVFTAVEHGFREVTSLKMSHIASKGHAREIWGMNLLKKLKAV